VKPLHDRPPSEAPQSILPERSRGTAQEWLAWLLLALAFSPVLADRVQEWRTVPFAPSLLLAPLLLAWAASRDRRPAAVPRPLLGLSILALGLAVLLTGLRLQATALAWLGLPGAVLGLALVRGRPHPDTATLAVWTVPIPTGLYLATTPWLEMTQLRVATAAVAWSGAPLGLQGTLVETASGRLYVDPSDGGQHLAWLLAGIGWFAALRARGRLQTTGGPRCGLGLLLASPLLALPLQTAGLLIAVALLAAGWPEAATIWLHTGLWLVVAASAIAWAEGPGGRSRPVKE